MRCFFFLLVDDDVDDDVPIFCSFGEGEVTDACDGWVVLVILFRIMSVQRLCLRGILRRGRGLPTHSCSGVPS